MKTLWALVLLVAALLVGWQFYIVNQNTTSSSRTNAPAENSSATPAKAPPAEPLKISESALDETLQEHEVEPGETLSSIGQRYNLKWTSIAELNGLTETTPLREGATIKLPLTLSGHLFQTRRLSFNQTEALTTQTEISFQNLLWRLEPLEVVRHTASADIGVEPNTSLTIKDQPEPGRVIVEGKPRGFLTRFYLTQPVKTGDDGVWFLERTEQYLPPSTL